MKNIREQVTECTKKITAQLNSVIAVAKRCDSLMKLGAENDMVRLLKLLRIMNASGSELHDVTDAEGYMAVVEKMRAQYLVCTDEMRTLSGLIRTTLYLRTETENFYAQLLKKLNITPKENTPTSEALKSADNTASGNSGIGELAIGDAELSTVPTGGALAGNIATLSKHITAMADALDRCRTLTEALDENSIDDVLIMIGAIAEPGTELSKIKTLDDLIAVIDRIRGEYLTQDEELSDLADLLNDTLFIQQYAENTYTCMMNRIKANTSLDLEGSEAEPDMLTFSAEKHNRPSIAGGDRHTAALRADGSVVAVGSNEKGQCNTISWQDIVAVAAGVCHTVGLKKDGTVVTAGNNGSSQCNTGSWSDIVAVAAGGWHTVGLKNDGTVVAVGGKDEGQRKTDSWQDIVAVAAGDAHTVGMKKSHTIVAVGRNDEGQCNTSSWRDIVGIATGSNHTVGLKKGGTVVAVGKNNRGQCNTGSWRDIVAITAGEHHTVGLKKDGTVVATGNNNDGQCNTGSWRDIVAIAAGRYHTVGLKKDGTLVAVGRNGNGQCNVQGIKGIMLPEE